VVIIVVLICAIMASTEYVDIYKYISHNVIRTRKPNDFIAVFFLFFFLIYGQENLMILLPSIFFLFFFNIEKKT